jgi:prepilin-type N-terminal cleavage/methylation domain-containing protein
MSFEFRVSSFESPSDTWCGGRRPGGTGRTRTREPETRNPKPETQNGAPAFTLIEIMIVVAIIAIVLTMGIPFMRSSFEVAKGLNGAVKGIEEVCTHARAMAIMNQTEMELRIRPGAGTFEVGGARASSIGEGGHPQMESKNLAGQDWRMNDRRATPANNGRGDSFVLPAGVQIEGLGINGMDWTEDDVAVVMFKKNGTCDEMNLVLTGDGNEKRNLWLEVVTGFVEVESDPYKFHGFKGR